MQKQNRWWIITLLGGVLFNNLVTHILLFVLGSIGIILQIMRMRKKHDYRVEPIIAWAYWLVLGWWGGAWLSEFQQMANVFHGDGHSLFVALTIALGGITLAVSLWVEKAMESHSQAINDFITLFSGNKKAPTNDKWEPINFDLGENVTPDRFRLGGE